MYRLSDIFSSIQGEGRHSGRPATFVRFASCNLKCPWCDTDNRERYVLRLDELLALVRKRKNKSVVVTGGEPSIQPDLVALVQALKNTGYWVAVETNGLARLERQELYDHVSVSPKPEYAARYMPDRMLVKADEVRIVAVSESIAPFCKKMRSLIQAADWYVSPLDEKGKMHYRRAFNLMTRLNADDPDMSPPWTLSVQLHKILGLK